MTLLIKARHPDRVLEEGAHFGYEWIVTSNGRGFRCGYVKVPLGHPWHGQRDESELEDISVHGGLNFTEPDVAYGEFSGDDGWWLGFHCAHEFYDLPDPECVSPEHRERFSSMYDADTLEILKRLNPKAITRDTGYVKGQCLQLCEQAAAAN